jgi:hypothetical protein
MPRRSANTRIIPRSYTASAGAATGNAVCSRTFLRFAFTLIFLIFTASTAFAQAAKPRAKKHAARAATPAMKKAASDLAALPSDPGERQLAQLWRTGCVCQSQRQE